MYRVLDELTPIVYSKEAPAVIRSALVSWYGCRRRVLPMAAPLTMDPAAKKARNGRVLMPLPMAD